MLPALPLRLDSAETDMGLCSPGTTKYSGLDSLVRVIVRGVALSTRAPSSMRMHLNFPVIETRPARRVANGAGVSAFSLANHADKASRSSREARAKSRRNL